MNGINSSFRKGVDHNRAGQMAIELMYSLKQDTSIETIPTNSSDMGEEYVYHVRFDEKISRFTIECESMYDGGKGGVFYADEFDGETLESLD